MLNDFRFKLTSNQLFFGPISKKKKCFVGNFRSNTIQFGSFMISGLRSNELVSNVRSGLNSCYSIQVLDLRSILPCPITVIEIIYFCRPSTNTCFVLC